MLTEKDYCDYETCVALKELGFPQDYIFARYAKVDKWVDYTSHKKGDLITSEDRFAFDVESESIVAPLLYEAQKWLREKDIFVHISHPLRVENDVFWNYEVLDEAWDDGKQTPCICASGGLFDSYEEALSKGIKVAVKILKEK